MSSTTTAGIEVCEIAAELDNLVGVCRAAAGSDEQRDQVRSLGTVAHSLETLNARLSEIGARMEQAAPADRGRDVNRVMWERLEAFQERNADLTTEEIIREFGRRQWDVFDRGAEAESLDERYLVQHSWTRKGLEHHLALEQLLASIDPECVEDAA